MNKVNKKIIIISTIILALVCAFVGTVLLGKNKESDEKQKENEVIENVELDNHIIKISEYKQHISSGNCILTSDNMDIVLESVESIIYEEERYELIS